MSWAGLGESVSRRLEGYGEGGAEGGKGCERGCEEEKGGLGLVEKSGIW